MPLVVNHELRELVALARALGSADHQGKDAEGWQAVTSQASSWTMTNKCHCSIRLLAQAGRQRPAEKGFLLVAFKSSKLHVQQQPVRHGT